MSSRSFSKNEVIFRQGDDAQEMFDIVSGSVGVYINYGQENETQLTVLKAGNFLGEMGLIENYPRSATAVAMEDGTGYDFAVDISGENGELYLWRLLPSMG